MSKGGQDLQTITNLPSLSPEDQRFLRQIRSQAMEASRVALGGPGSFNPGEPPPEPPFIPPGPGDPGNPPLPGGPGDTDPDTIRPGPINPLNVQAQLDPNRFISTTVRAPGGGQNPDGSFQGALGRSGLFGVPGGGNVDVSRDVLDQLTNFRTGLSDEFNARRIRGNSIRLAQEAGASGDQALIDRVRNEQLSGLDADLFEQTLLDPDSFSFDPNDIDLDFRNESLNSQTIAELERLTGQPLDQLLQALPEIQAQAQGVPFGAQANLVAPPPPVFVGPQPDIPSPIDPGTLPPVDPTLPPPIMGGGGDSFFTGPQQRSVDDIISPFFNPFEQQVTDATRAEFDHLRGLATRGTNQQATAAGAFGDARQGVAEGTRLGELDRSQASTIADLNQRNFLQALSFGLPFAEQQRLLEQQQLQEPLFRQSNALNFLTQALGPIGIGGTQTITQPGGGFGGAASGALGGAASGFAVGGPLGAGIGGLLGLL